MKRRILMTMLAFCLLLWVCVAAGAEANQKEQAVSALKAAQALVPEEIQGIDYTRGTEGGIQSGSVTDPETIQEICRRLAQITLGEERNIGTTDDDLSLNVNTGEGILTLRFEGGNFAAEGKRYAADGLHLLKRYLDGLLTTETEEASSKEDPYPYWDYYNGYAYENRGQLKYWIEFRDEFYLHCLFRSGEPEYHEEVFTLYPDRDNSPAQQLTIAAVADAKGNDVSDWFESLVFLFSSEDMVLMQVSRNEKTLAGGEEENILTGEYTLLPREKNTPEQLCALAREYYNRNFNFDPPEAAITDNGDGTYTIHLYELVTLDQGETHTATSAWYTVDAYGVGTNDITGQLVQLAQ